MPTGPSHFDVHCPRCGIAYRLPREAKGRHANCRCGQRFVVEAASGSTTANVSDPKENVSDEISEEDIIEGRIDVSPVSVPPPQKNAEEMFTEAIQDVPAIRIPVPTKENPYLERYVPGGLPQPVFCQEHSSSRAVYECDECGRPLCPTCRFDFPNGSTCCVECIRDNGERLTVVRSIMIHGALACATIASLSMVLLAGGLLPILMESILGLVIIDLCSAFPVILGLGASIGAYSKTYENPVTLWVGVVWNSFLLVCLGIFAVAGALIGYV